MIEEFLQLRLDQALATCPQRWALGGLAVAAAVASSVLATVGSASGQGVAVMLLATVAAAVAAVSASGSHIGAAVVGFLAFQWVAFAGGDTGWRLIAVAACLFTFHGLLALMAAVPHTSVIDRRVLRSWTFRSVWVLAGTVAVWALVAAFEGRLSDGNEVLTVVGLLIIAAVLVAVRRASATWWGVPVGTAGVTGSGTRPSGRGSTTS